MNSTAKVTVLYAFSNDGQSTEPYFIFPDALRSEQSTVTEQDAYNEFGHVTPSIFLSWVKSNLVNKGSPLPIIISQRISTFSVFRAGCLGSRLLLTFARSLIHCLAFPRAASDLCLRLSVHAHFTLSLPVRTSCPEQSLDESDQ